MKCPDCPTPELHTPGFETGYGGTSINGQRIYLTGAKKTHAQEKCPGCGLWVIARALKG